MPTQLNSEAIFLEYLGWINRVIDMTCSKHGLWGSDAEDFASWVQVKLIENDYAVIRHSGESGLKSYLVILVNRQLQEFWRQRWGRWRTSAAARQLGSPAPELETLVYRDGYRLEQAGEKLRIEGRTSQSDAELARLLAKLPHREPLRPVEVPPDTVLSDAEAASRADERVLSEEAEQQRGRVLEALDRAMDKLGPEDCMIVRMHFQEGHALAYVARALNLERKPLYRRAERLRALLKASMEREGVSGADVYGMIGDEDKRLLDSLYPGILGPDGLALTQKGERLQNLGYPGILGPDGLPLTQENLQGSRIITDLTSTNEKILRMVRNDPQTMYNLTPRQFEKLVAELLHEQGYEIALTPASNDGGFDMYAAKKDGLGEFLYLVECKRYAPIRAVGVNVVRALYGIVQQMKACAGIVVTTSHFTRGAKAFQQSVRYQLSLRDYLHLQQWLGATIIEPPLDMALTTG
ncbi:MAG TPA: restriction endonuclease [Longimicrobium sp.]|nr:restriction endonuclease [Longimicrobium sp.]